MNKKLTAVVQTTILVIALLAGQMLLAQSRYTIRTDPKNAKRNIIDLQPEIKKTVVYEEKRNALDAPKFVRAAIAFTPFEMRNPKTGKALNGDAVLTIKMPDGTERKTTVKQYFEQLNKLEKAMSARGRSLRAPNAFADLKPDFKVLNYNKTPKLGTGFQTNSFKINPVIITSKTSGGRPGPITTKPVEVLSTVTPPVINVLSKMVFVAWANLYTGNAEGEGKPEFPQQWAASSSVGGRSIYPVLLQVPTMVEGAIKRVDWQVSEEPFDGTLKDMNVPGIQLTGTINPILWSRQITGSGPLSNSSTSSYSYFNIDLKKIQPLHFLNAVKPYYLRCLLYDGSNELLKVSDQVIFNYGFIEKPTPIQMTYSEPNFVPGFNYQFPETSIGDVPFGVFIKGSGFKTDKYVTRLLGTGDEKPVPIGYRVSANALFGLKHFNFSSLVNEQEPKSIEDTIIMADFNAQLGVTQTSQVNNNDQGVKLTLSFPFLKLKPDEIGFTKPVPGVPNSISLEYDVVKTLDEVLLDVHFMLGLIPISIKSGITGEAGVKFFGQANTTFPFEVSGGISPFVHTRYYVSGGVNALLAYATVNSEVNPILNVDMPMTFTSAKKKSLSLNTNISALKGRVYLKVGFYYPCPSLEKIIGFITGDEDLPLCECSWEYDIYNFPGFTHTYAY